VKETNEHGRLQPRTGIRILELIREEIVRERGGIPSLAMEREERAATAFENVVEELFAWKVTL